MPFWFARTFFVKRARDLTLQDTFDCRAHDNRAKNLQMEGGWRSNFREEFDFPTFLETFSIISCQ
jgi:hypothetical protein